MNNTTYTVKFMAQLLFMVFRLVLHKKTSFFLSKASLIGYKAGKQPGVTNTKFKKYTLSEGTYSVDDFNAKFKISILQQRQGWESPQIKDLNLVIPKDYLFMTDNSIFYALGMQDKYLEKTTLVKSTLPSPPPTPATPRFL